MISQPQTVVVFTVVVIKHHLLEKIKTAIQSKKMPFHYDILAHLRSVQFLRHVQQGNTNSDCDLNKASRWGILIS